MLLLCGELIGVQSSLLHEAPLLLCYALIGVPLWEGGKKVGNTFAKAFPTNIVF